MDAFKSLVAGTKFKASKHSTAMDLFKGKTTHNTNVKMDLFSKTPVASIVTSSDDVKKSKREQQAEIEESNEQPVAASSSSALLQREDEINAFRNKLRIKVKGDNIPTPCATFDDMVMNKEVKKLMLKNIEMSYWKEPTPIQMQAIPVLLEGRDILAAAPTGSGKTASYVIPALSKLEKPSAGNHGVRVLLLAPTKELTDQIYREVLRLGEGKRFKVCNLKKNIMTRAISSNGKGAFAKYDIMIATPLRLVSLIRAKVIDLTKVEMIVLDEADKLLELDSGRHGAGDEDDEDIQLEQEEDDSDDDEDDEETGKKKRKKMLKPRERSAFLNQVDEILAECPSTTADNHNPNGIVLQRCLFSATIGQFVKELAEGFLNNPVQVTIGTENAGANTIKQRLVFVGREDGKLLAIRQLVQEGLKPPVLLFLQSIDRAKELFRELVYDGINVDIMHANRSPAQREEVMRRFRLGEIWVLICTDLMARGIDFQGVQMVINYDLPNTAVSYIHRIGRTGRAGRTGEAVTLFTEQDLPRLRPIANVVKLSGCEVPEWMLGIKAVSLHFIVVSSYNSADFVSYFFLNHR